MALELVVSIIMLTICFSILLDPIISASVIEEPIEKALIIESTEELVHVKEEDFIVKSGVLAEGSDFALSQYVSAKNSRGEDISKYITILEPIDTSTPGVQDLKVVLRYNGQTYIKTAKYYIISQSIIDG